MDVAAVELLILDVDGVLTDGRIVTAPGGGATKAFCAQDGFAVRLWQRAGGKLAILSGRADEVVAKRARELGIERVRTGVADKTAGYRALLDETACPDNVVGYVGDDLPDLGPMTRCGFPVAVANATPAVKRVAHYVTRRAGGCGAVAEVVELLLRQRGQWSQVLGELIDR
jgi:3-deoxy-D-manno-octulosonate 8-phosphate phosphatase (KDO 8-P phosphatase)